MNAVHYHEKDLPKYQIYLEQYLEEAPLDILAAKETTRPMAMKAYWDGNDA